MPHPLAGDVDEGRREWRDSGKLKQACPPQVVALGHAGPSCKPDYSKKLEIYTLGCYN